MTQETANNQVKHDSDEYRYRAVLVGLHNNVSALITVDESLDELQRLLETDDGIALGRLIQSLSEPHPTYYIGKGKAEDLRALVARTKANCVLFDDELSPRQQATLEDFFGQHVLVMDRTSLILEIFARHATTKEGKLQVELATLEYQLPRLRGLWAHLEKEKLGGGRGARFGTGESQLETDRRLARKRITAIKRQLELVKKDRLIQRAHRLENAPFRVSLVGYTNAGKSSLLNALTGADVLAYDKLFATLDSTTRKLELPDNQTVTLTDTVGFIHKLPHQLVAAFRSTLEEVKDAQLLLHVVDASSSLFDMQVQAVNEVLEQIGAHVIPTLLVCNKMDAVSDLERDVLMRKYPQAVFVSAVTHEGFDDLLAQILHAMRLGSESMTVLIPYSEGKLIESAHSLASVLSLEYLQEGVSISMLVPHKFVSLFEDYRQ